MSRSSQGAGVSEGESAPGLSAAALDALPDAVVLVEAGSGRVLLANHAARAAPGLAGLDGRHDGVAVCEMSDGGGWRLAAEQTPIARAARGESFAGLRVDCRAAGGGRTTYLVSATPLGGQGGGRAAPDRMLVRFADVTDIGSAEAELRESVRARDEFVSIATHELKEPLTSILLTLELLELLASQGPAVASEEVLDSVGVVRRQGDRLARLIENLLDVTRINNARLTLDREPVDLCALLHDCVEHFKEEARRAGSELTFGESEPSGPCIGYFDKLRLE